METLAEVHEILELPAKIDAYKRVEYVLIEAQGRRAQMEDATCVKVSEFNNSEVVVYLGVYDGHGGSWVANSCKQQLHKIVFKRLQENFNQVESLENSTIERVMKESFEEMDHWLFVNSLKEDVVCNKQGSTGCTVMINKDNYIFSHVGDSKAVLIRDDHIVHATRDHKVKVKEERDRVNKSAIAKAGYNSDGEFRMVNVTFRSSLDTTRCFGDWFGKMDFTKEPSEQPLISIPETHIVPRHADDQLVVVATDGLWNYMSEKDAVAFLLQKLKAGGELLQATKELMQQILENKKRKWTDNISVIVLSFMQ